MKEVLFYTRPRCCLCDDALAVVEAVRRAHPFRLRVLDVDADEDTRARYGGKIPVVVVDGRMHAKYRVDARAFLRCLESPPAPSVSA